MTTTRSAPVARAVQQSRRRGSTALRQTTMWDAIRVQNHAIRQARDGTLLDRFARWLEAHPELPDLAAGIALQLKEAGHAHYSIDGIWHILRWEHGVKAPSRTGSGDPETPEVVSLNNDFTAPMSRLLEERYPYLKGFFRQRKSQADQTEVA